MKVFPITKERYFRAAQQSLLGVYTRKAVYKVRLAMSPLWQFTPFSLRKTDADSCVIGNAIPKSGTHLLESIHAYLGKWENIRIGLANDAWSTSGDRLGKVPDGQSKMFDCVCSARFHVKKLRNGQMAQAGFSWSKGLERTIARVTDSRRIKHVFIYRDPRDIIISHMNWATYSDSFIKQGGEGVKARRKFWLESFASDDERLTHVIKNKINHILVKSYALSFEPWLHSSHCFAVKFEDLYPDIVDLKTGVLGDTLRNLLNYLEVDAATIDPIVFYNKVYLRGFTASSVEDKVGQYKRMFKDRHYALLDTREFRDTLQAFGYEW